MIIFKFCLQSTVKKKKKLQKRKNDKYNHFNWKKFCYDLVLTNSNSQKHKKTQDNFTKKVCRKKYKIK